MKSQILCLSYLRGLLYVTSVLFLAMVPLDQSLAYGGGHGGGHASGRSGHAFSGGRGNYGRGYYGRGYYGGGFYGRGFYGCCGFRPYGPAFLGFGFFYDDYLAWPYLDLEGWELADYAYLNEDEVRSQENAMVGATTGPLNEAITWNDNSASGSVTPIREGHTANGRVCREFQQQITVNGRPQRAYGTACQQSDGSWHIVNQ